MRAVILVLLLGAALAGCSHPSAPSTGIPDPGTATARLSSVDSLAKAIDPDLQLVYVKGDKVMPDGFSRTWLYAYGNTAKHSGFYWFHADSKGIGYDSIAPLQLQAGCITHKWCNSDSAMHVAERDGGGDFRKANSPCTVTACLGELAVSPPITRWWIDYRSYKGEQCLLFAIDASTGKVILAGP